MSPLEFKKETVTHFCPACKNLWTKNMFLIINMWKYEKPTDILCPECKHKGVPLRTFNKFYEGQMIDIEIV